MLVPETTFVIVYVPPAPKFPEPFVAVKVLPAVKPAVCAIPVIVAFHGPVPVIDPIVPV